MEIREQLIALELIGFLDEVEFENQDKGFYQFFLLRCISFFSGAVSLDSRRDEGRDCDCQVPYAGSVKECSRLQACSSAQAAMSRTGHGAASHQAASSQVASSGMISYCTNSAVLLPNA